MTRRTRLPASSGRYLYARYRKRLAAAVLLSLLAHAFVLSLQFGLPGLGLPGLELRWDQRRAQPSGLSMVLLQEKRAVQPEIPAQPGTPPEQAPAPVAGTQTTTRPEPVPRKPSTAASITAARRKKAGRQAAASMPAQTFGSRAGARIIARTDGDHDTFAVMPRLFDEPDQAARPKRDARADIFRQSRQAASIAPTPADSVLVTTEQTPREQTPAKEDADEMRAEEAKKDDAQHQAQELETRRLAEEAANRQAAMLALQAEQKRAEEESSRRTQELEAKRRDELTQQEEAKAASLAREIEARRQAEEAARQAEQQRVVEENTRHAQELEAKRLEELRRQEEARAQKMAQEREERRQAEEAARLAEQKRQDEERARHAQELEVKQREAQRLQEEANAKRRAMELESQRQAEEAARRQEEERRRQAEAIAAKEKAEAEARRQAEAAASQRERERQAADSRQAAESDRTAAMPALANGIGGGLAGKALEQARTSDALHLQSHTSQQAPESTNNTRRRSVLGRVDQDVGLMMYVESWKLKIERNGRLNYRHSQIDAAYTEPIVTVSIRSDGSIENIIFDRRSGRAELDDAVQRIVRLNARYSAFPPELARRYDVIEIRRVWNFDEKLKLMEEMR